jgi:Protein of unknown function (DUF4058)
MKRRFPGVDPYLEDPAFWRDFHESFIIYARDAIRGQLPDNYDVRVDERINLTGPDGESTAQFLPDVTFSWEPPTASWSRSAGDGGVAVMEPVKVPFTFMDEERESYLEIMHRPSQSLVTVLELLSPANKVSPGYHDYLTKRNLITREPVHLVELDFLLGGKRMPARKPLPPGHHYAMVSRYEERPLGEVYAWSLRDILPAIRIPLREPDEDFVLNLAAVYEETFTKGRYQRNLRYDRTLAVPVSSEVSEWMAALGETAT